MAPYLDDPRSVELPREVRINGARFFVAAGRTGHPPQHVRRFYRDRYEGRDGGLRAFATDLEKKRSLPQGIPAAHTFEFGDGERGGVASLDWGAEKHGIAEIVRRMGRLAETGDLGEVARLRYAYTERRDDGGTRFLTVWTDETLSFRQLLPASGVGDAPGFDIDGIPRFPGTTRALSMEEAGNPQRLTVHEGGGSPSTAAMFYRSRMKQAGWVEETTFAELAAHQQRHALHFLREGHEAFLSFSDREDGQGVSIVALQTH